MTTDEQIAALQAAQQELATGVAQIATDCVQVIRTVNGLKAALDKALSGFELLVEDYGRFKSETARRVEALEASAPKKATPPAHGWN